MGTRNGGARLRRGLASVAWHWVRAREDARPAWFTQSLGAIFGVRWDHEPTPNPSQEGNFRGGGRLFVPLLGGVGGGFRVQSSRFKVRCSILEVGCWLLEVGCWLLVVESGSPPGRGRGWVGYPENGSQRLISKAELAGRARCPEPGAAGNEAQQNIQHRTSNIQLPMRRSHRAVFDALL